VKEEIARAVTRIVVVVLGPIRRVPDLHAGAEDRLHIGGERLQFRHRGEIRRAVTNRRERLELRADQEGVYRAGVDRVHRDAELRVVQDETPEAPFIRSRIEFRDRAAAHVHVGSRGRPEERVNLVVTDPCADCSLQDVGILILVLVDMGQHEPSRVDRMLHDRVPPADSAASVCVRD
jgi:hypothetical protein